ncbi:hypothetical protein PR048_009873 [Dryococelus australis]|uniref:RRM domain-containing protein n=1 Tax=Dryococelus australis TaxID=614101 RepID=A0ABQ9I258_9NEOP|nr:hypothetical protein PR048_009873 [Dryococelus australis]
MSRLIVKNLPKSITNEKLQEVFSEKGVVTDVQLKFTKDGKFRHFGFVGYKTPEEAKTAMEHFNGSCINASRLQIELCAGLGDPKKPKAWSKYAVDSSFSVIKKEKATKDEEGKKFKLKKQKEHKNDPLFVEFMEVHAKDDKSVWSDGGVLSSESPGVKISLGHSAESSFEEEESDDDDGAGKTGTAANADISDMEYLKYKMQASVETDDETSDVSERKKNVKQPKKWVEFYTVKVRGLPYTAKKKEIKQFFSPLRPKTIRIPPKMKGFAYVGFKTEKDMKRALIKNMSFLGEWFLCIINVVQFFEHHHHPKTSHQYILLMNSLEGKESTWKEQEEGLKNEETIAESGRIFIRNLSYTITEDDLTQLFSKYGPVTEVIMPVDRMTRKAKGYALITYMVPENAITAYTELDGSVIQGRMLHLLPGKAKQSLEELLEKEGLTFKQKQTLKKKSEAASSHNWNTLFLGPNAVADIIAETYNTTKEKVLDSGGKESVAVRLALGETQIVSEMREFLEESGVRLDAFNQPTTQRSKTVILAKNLPAKTTDTEIRTLFAKFGELGRVVLPPSGVTAIVEFLEPSEAKTAFMKLAYTRFKHLPLYLEWAPSNTFTSPTADEKLAKDKDTAQAKNTILKNMPASIAEKDVKPPKDDVNNSSDEENDEPEPNSTLFIKNLNFKTSEDNIREHFRNCGSIHSVTIATRKDPNFSEQLLSMGYGFIHFKKHAAVEKALKILQHSVLDDFTIELKRSNRILKGCKKRGSAVFSTGKQLAYLKIANTGKIFLTIIPNESATWYTAVKPNSVAKIEVRVFHLVQLYKFTNALKPRRLFRKHSRDHRIEGDVEFFTAQATSRAVQTHSYSTRLLHRGVVVEWKLDANTCINYIKQKRADAHTCLTNLPHTAHALIA